MAQLNWLFKQRERKVSDAIWQQRGHTQEDLKLTLRDSLKSSGVLGESGMWRTWLFYEAGPARCRTLGQVIPDDSVQHEVEELTVMEHSSSLVILYLTRNNP